MYKKIINNQAVLYPLLLLFSLIIISALTAFLFLTRRLWIANIMFCLTLVLLEGVILLSGVGWHQFFKIKKETRNITKFTEKYSVILILYVSISFFIAFFVFSIAFAKSYMMAQVMIFLCGVVCSLSWMVIIFFTSKDTGLAIPFFGSFKAGYLCCLLYLIITFFSFKLIAYNPAFFHKTYKGYISESSVTDINQGDVITIRFSYQTYKLLDEIFYEMRLTVMHDSKRLFGKFGHGMVFGTMSVNASNILDIDVFDYDSEDEDPEVTFNTKEALFTYHSIDKYKGKFRALIDD